MQFPVIEAPWIVVAKTVSNSRQIGSVHKQSASVTKVYGKFLRPVLLNSI